MEKIERKYLAHYIDCAAPKDEEILYVRLGEGLEEYTVEMSAKVDKKRNILGQLDVAISGYEKSAKAELWFADPDTELYARLQRIVDFGETMDDLKTSVIDVKMWLPPLENGYRAVKNHGYIEVKSYGGDAAGYQIPFTVHFTGEQEYGYFDLDSKIFTPIEDKSEW